MKHKTPLSYIYKNMVVSNSSAHMFAPLKRFSFVYRIIGDPYDLMPNGAKRNVIDKLTSLIIDLSATTKIFGVPHIQDISHNFVKEQERIKRRQEHTGEPFPLQDMMVDYDGLIERVLKSDMEENGQSQAITYLLVEAPGKSFDMNTVKQFRDGFFSQPLNALQRLVDGQTRFTDSELSLMEETSNRFLVETRAKGIRIETVTSQEIVAVLSSARTRGLPVFEDVKHDFILNKRHGYYEPYTHDLEPIFNAKFSFEHDKTLSVTTEHGTSYQAFINVFQIPPTLAPGGEWIHNLRKFDFPISWTIYINPQEKDATKSFITSKKLRIASEQDNARKANMSVSKELNQSAKAIKHIDDSIQTENAGARQMCTTFCIFADSVDVLENRISHVMNHFKDQKFKLSRSDNRTDLMNAYKEMLLTADHHVSAFHILVPSVNIASTVFASATPIGDDSGRYIGHTGRTKERVFLNQANAILEDRSGNMAIVADLGGGKSFFVNLMSYLSVMHNDQVIQIDPKGGRAERFSQYLPELKHYLNIITIENSEYFIGVFDPFNLYPDDYVEVTTSGGIIRGYELARALATDILYDSIQEMSDKKEIILHRALNDMAKMKNKSMSLLVETMRTVYLKDKKKPGSLYEDSLIFADLIDTLNVGLSKLFFGAGTDQERERALDLRKPWTVIETQNIPYPDSDKSRSEYTKEETASSVLNGLILNTVRTHAYKKRPGALRIDVDEAHVYKESRVGSATISQMAKMSRQLNFYINFLIHSLDDLPKTVLNTLSYVAYFVSDNTEEIPRRLEFIGLESSKSNIQVVKNLKKGECILKDHHGNIAKIQIDALIPRLIEAFSSTPES